MDTPSPGRWWLLALTLLGSGVAVSAGATPTPEVSWQWRGLTFSWREPRLVGLVTLPDRSLLGSFVTRAGESRNVLLDPLRQKTTPVSGTGALSLKAPGKVGALSYNPDGSVTLALQDPPRPGDRDTPRLRLLTVPPPPQTGPTVQGTSPYLLAPAAIDRDGCLHLLGHLRDRFYRVCQPPPGSPLKPEALVPEGLPTVRDFDVDDQGRVVYFDGADSAVVWLDANGKTRARRAFPHEEAGALRYPLSIAALGGEQVWLGAAVKSEGEASFHGALFRLGHETTEAVTLEAPLGLPIELTALPGGTVYAVDPAHHVYHVEGSKVAGPWALLPPEAATDGPPVLFSEEGEEVRGVEAWMELARPGLLQCYEGLRGLKPVAQGQLTALVTVRDRKVREVAFTSSSIEEDFGFQACVSSALKAAKMEEVRGRQQLPVTLEFRVSSLGVGKVGP